MYHDDSVSASRHFMHNATCIVLIKTSSLGDVLHNLPVVSDIRRHLPDARIGWVVEESFAALPSLHPDVAHVIPVAIRRWRNSWWNSRSEITGFCSALKGASYDFALDTQGLLKSALITRCAQTLRCGYAWSSAREPLASLFYDRRFTVAKNLHAVERNRLLAAAALGYTPQGAANYGIHAPELALAWLPDSPYVTLLHATSRDDKLWDEQNWIALGKHLYHSGLRAMLPWGNAKERSRAERLCAAIPASILAPPVDLNEAAVLLGKARAVIGVDTGLSHLAAALGVPTVGLYTATDPGLTGLYAGAHAVNLGGIQAPPSVDSVVATLNRLGVGAHT
ncbi:MAG: lipopolysaccharide heptosyltransferase I [Sideroxyarcus sp.]|nr:lipopolysaccharide heptosyltransferase I [Sideroxyarcus sp.]